MNATIPAVKLHLNKREMTFLVPLYITAIVAVVSVLVSLLLWRGGAVPGSADWIEGSRANAGILWSLAGFLGYMGVQSVSTTFPFALTLGATRRAFAVGTFLWAAATSAYLAVILGVLLQIELATEHWFAGFYIFDVNILGAGKLWILLPTVFLATLTVLTVGGMYGAAWTRFGPKGPILVGVTTGLVLLIAQFIIIPEIDAIVAAFQSWWLVVAALVVTAVSGVGTWWLLRSASVR